MFDKLLNNPLLFTAIILIVVLVGVGLVLYFLVYKNRIKEYIAKKKLEKENKVLQREKNKALVSDVFSNKDVEDKKQKELSKEDHELINKKLSSVATTGEALVTKAKDVKKNKTELTKEEQEEIERKLASVGATGSKLVKRADGTVKSEKQTLSKEEQEEIDRKIASVGINNQKLVTSKDEVKKETQKQTLSKEEQEELEKRISGAFGKTIIEQTKTTAKTKETKKNDDDDDNVPHVGGFDFMNQFNKKD